MTSFARVGRIFVLAAACSGAAVVGMLPSRSVSAPETRASGYIIIPSTDNKSTDLPLPRLGNFAIDVVAQNKDAFPYGKSYNFPGMTPSDISTKWNEAQSRIRADEAAIASCRSDHDTCSPAALRFLSIVDLGRQHEGRARLGWINRAVNMAIRSTSDWVQYGSGDFWASPLQTLGNGAGDCEDYAIVKYVALRELGVLPDDLRLVIVQDEKRDVGHAVVAIRHDQQWLVLDNRTMAILDADQVRDYRPLFALDQQGTRAIATAAVINQ